MLCSLLLILALALPADAISLQGTVSSMLWNREVPALQSETTRWQAYESLRLRAQEGSVSAFLHARLARFDDWQPATYQGYLAWQHRMLTLRVGRQFLPNDVGFWQMDGLQATLRRTPFRAILYGGSAIAPWDEKRSGVSGLDVQWTQAPLVQLRGNVVALFDADRLQRLIVGGQVGTLGASLPGVHPTAWSAQGYGRVNVDLLSGELVSGVGFVSVGLPQASVYGEYQRETPFFPEDSIFTVFAVEPWEQAAVGFRCQPWDRLEVSGRYARQFYEAGPLHRFRFGVRLGPLGSYVERLDEEGREYWRIHSTLKLPVGPWWLALNHYYNHYRKAPVAPLETAYSYQIQVGYRLRQVQLMVRLEDNVNPDFEYNVRGLGMVRWRFGTRF